MSVSGEDIPATHRAHLIKYLGLNGGYCTYIIFVDRIKYSPETIPK
jgi:hypothetical protein